jgi:HSP20 family molecular chaperone IbpA
MTYSIPIPSIMHKALYGHLLNDFHKVPKRKSFPITDLYQDEDGKQIIEMALAGYSKDSITIEVKSNQITISSSGIKTDRESNIARRGFQKTFVDYNNEMDLTKAKASFTQGLLKIVISPKPTYKQTLINIE